MAARLQIFEFLGAAIERLGYERLVAIATARVICQCLDRAAEIPGQPPCDIERHVWEVIVECLRDHGLGVRHARQSMPGEQVVGCG